MVKMIPDGIMGVQAFACVYVSLQEGERKTLWLTGERRGEEGGWEWGRVAG